MKKKILMLMLSIFIIATPAFASCNCSELCAPKPYGLSSGVAQTFSNVSGATWLGQTVAQSVIKKQLKKATKENFSVKVKAYSIQDLMSGKFKSMKVSGRNLDFDGIYLTSMEFNTLCDFNYFDRNAKVFKENMLLGFSTEISDTDLRKTMHSKGYLDMLNNVCLSSMGINLFRLSGADVRIKNNKVYFTIKVSSQLLMGKKQMDIVVATDLKVEDGKIVLTKVDIENLFTRIDLSKITYLLNAINPLTFSTNIIGKGGTTVSIQNVNIIGNRIIVTGNIFIPKGTKI